MRVPPIAIPGRLVGMILVASLVGCGSSPTESAPDEMPDFEGTYALTGTYDGRTHGSALGSIVVSGQVGAAATATIAVQLFDNGNIFFALNDAHPDISATSAPQAAQLKSDGSFSVTFRGREVISGLDPASCCDYTFAFQGKLSGDRIDGRWTLTRDMPSHDTGTLTATR